MSNSVNGVNGYGNGYGNYGYYKQNGREDGNIADENRAAQPQVNVDETYVTPERVMDYLAAANLNLNATRETQAVELDIATVGRISDSMARFEALYAIIQDEFGKTLAPNVMDVVMDKIMGKWGLQY